MRHLRTSNFILATAVVALVGTAAYAATQGAVGGNSTGTIDVSVQVNDEVRISNLTDISGVFDGTNDVTGTSAACVYRNGTGLYRLTASGDGIGGAFTLTDGVIATPIPYSVSFDDGNGAQSLGAGSPLTGLNGADPTSDTCATTGNNGTVAVSIGATDLLSAPASTYAGTLTLVVAPE